MTAGDHAPADGVVPQVEKNLMASKTSVTVSFNRFPEIAAALPKETDEVVRKAAFDIEARAKDRARVDTGALKSSIYVTLGSGESDYAQAASAAQAANPGVEVLPPADKPQAHEALVGPSVEYGAFVEFGTRNTPAHPFMIPAAEEVRPAFVEAMKKMLQDLGK